MNNRREALKKMGIGALGLTSAGASSLSAAQSSPQRVSVGPAFGTEAQIKPLAFEADQLDGISERVITSHWENNYAGSVRALNTVKARLNELLNEENVPAFIYNDLKREHLMRNGSVILHELYFDNLAPPGDRNGELDNALTSAFGSTAAWEREFRLVASGLGGGSGWVMLGWNHQFSSLENYWMADHMHCPVTVSPILVLDMYEHSYHMDYGSAAGQYIAAFMRNIDWNLAARRLDTARSAGAV